MRSAEESMALLGSLRTALPLGLQESLMDQSSRTVFSMYHADLQKVLRRYTKRAKAPPLPRNFPQAAGHVAWARQLRESVESPMRAMCKEAGTRSLLARSGGGAGQEVQDVVATYTRLTSVLKQYEKLWYTGWCRAVDLTMCLPQLAECCPQLKKVTYGLNHTVQAYRTRDFKACAYRTPASKGASESSNAY